MSLSPPYDALVPELKRAEYAGLSDADALAYLKAKRTAGPVPMYESELAGLLTDGANNSLVKLLNYVNFGLVKADIEAQNRAGVALWAGKLALLGILTAAEASAIQSYTQRTENNTPIAWASGIQVGHIVSARALIAAGA